MKLVELLARELKEWPSGCKIITQSILGNEIYGGRSAGAARKICKGVDLSCRHSEEGYPEVTRADWEAEKARIAGKVDGGWKRHKRKSQPVSDGAIVEIRTRGGEYETCEASCFSWGATGNSQIMAYRIHKPAEQLAPVSEPVESANAPEPILTIRNRIYELDTQRAELEATYQRQIGEIAKERGELVGKLAGEGLALVEQVQPVEDMSDWRNWKAGDFLECVDISDKHCAAIQLGELYQYKGFGDVIDDDGDEQAYPVKHGKCFKWHSRPGKS